jgi:hypothetical protein
MYKIEVQIYAEFGNIGGFEGKKLYVPFPAIRCSVESCIAGFCRQGRGFLPVALPPQQKLCMHLLPCRFYRGHGSRSVVADNTDKGTEEYKQKRLPRLGGEAFLTMKTIRTI